MKKERFKMQSYLKRLSSIISILVATLIGSQEIQASTAYIPSAPLEGSGVVNIINIEDGNLIYSMPVGELPMGAILNPQGNRLYVLVSEGDRSNLKVIDTSNRSILESFTVASNNPRTFSFNSDASKLYVADYGSSSIKVVNLNDTSNPISSIGDVSRPYGITMGRNGYLYVTDQWQRQVIVINTTNNQVVDRVNLPLPPYGLVADPNRDTIYVALNAVNYGGRDSRGDSRVAVLRFDFGGSAPSHSYTDIPLTRDSNPTSLALNSRLDRLYIANQGIDGDENHKGNIASIESISQYTGTNPFTIRTVMPSAENKINHPLGIGIDPFSDKVVVTNTGVFLAGGENFVTIFDKDLNAPLSLTRVASRSYAFGNFIAPTVYEAVRPPLTPVPLAPSDRGTEGGTSPGGTTGPEGTPRPDGETAINAAATPQMPSFDSPTVGAQMNGGGRGCSMNPQAKPDFTFATLSLLMFPYFILRRKTHVVK